jgi:MFS family permease
MAAFLLGCINALDRPAQEAFTMELAGPAHVANAAALNNAVRTSGRPIGPAIGGLLIASAGIVPCFLINAVSYAAVVAALWTMNPAVLHPEATAPRHRGHVWGHPALRTVLLILTLVSTVGIHFQVLLTLLAIHRLPRSCSTSLLRQPLCLVAAELLEVPEVEGFAYQGHRGLGRLAGAVRAVR